MSTSKCVFFSGIQCNNQRNQPCRKVQFFVSMQLKREVFRMKEAYETPEMEIIEFAVEDIITTSEAE